MVERKTEKKKKKTLLKVEENTHGSFREIKCDVMGKETERKRGRK
jgi:hypothetical protein